MNKKRIHFDSKFDDFESPVRKFYRHRKKQKDKTNGFFFKQQVSNCLLREATATVSIIERDSVEDSHIDIKVFSLFMRDRTFHDINTLMWQSSVERSENWWSTRGSRDGSVGTILSVGTLPLLSSLTTVACRTSVAMTTTALHPSRYDAHMTATTYYIHTYIHTFNLIFIPNIQPPLHQHS